MVAVAAGCEKKGEEYPARRAVATRQRVVAQGFEETLSGTESEEERQRKCLWDVAGEAHPLGRARRVLGIGRRGRFEVCRRIKRVVTALVRDSGERFAESAPVPDCENRPHEELGGVGH